MKLIPFFKTKKKVPTFGGVLKIEEHNLTPSGADAVKRILCVVAMEYVELEQLPFLPDLSNY